jgi:hypothetical protein
MKTTIAIFLISVTAYGQATVFQDASVPSDSQVIIRNNIKTIGGDENIVAYTSNPIWRLKADTNITGYVDSIRIDSYYGVQGFKNLTLAQFEAQITKDVRPPDKQKIKVQTREDLEANYEQMPKSPDVP